MQDVSSIKQNDDIRPAVEQHNITQNINHNIEIKKNQVYQKKDEDMDSEYDSAKGNSKNEYFGNNGKRKKHKEDEEGVVTIKQRVTFDVKI